MVSGKVRLVEPTPLGKPRSHDPQDDPYLAAALSARAVIVTYDKELLDLGKPFGVEILGDNKDAYEHFTKLHAIMRDAGATAATAYGNTWSGW